MQIPKHVRNDGKIPTVAFTINLQISNYYLHLVISNLSGNANVFSYLSNLFFNPEYLFIGVSFLSAIYKAFFCPTNITKFFARVIPVYNRFLCNIM